MTTPVSALITEMRSAAATLRSPTGTFVPAQDRASAELIERAADAIRAMQRAPLPATAVTTLLPTMQDGWTVEDYGTWAIRAAERAHGIAGDAANPPPPSWSDAPKGYNRAMDSDGHWWWFAHRPYTETFGDYEGWDSEDGIREARGLRFYPGWKETLGERPEAADGRP